MTSSAITRPGERERLVVKFGQIDWTLTLVLCLIAAAGGMMLYSIAGGAWRPWAAPHLIRFGLCLALMLALALVDLRAWYAVAYPLYGMGFLLLAAVMVVGHRSLGATRWLEFGPLGVQPSEIMKIGLVLALARFYNGLPADKARWSWWLMVPAGMILVPAALVAKEPDLGTAILLVATGGTVMMLAGLSIRVIIAGAAALLAAAPFARLVLKGHIISGLPA